MSNENIELNGRIAAIEFMLNTVVASLEMHKAIDGDALTTYCYQYIKRHNDGGLDNISNQALQALKGLTDEIVEMRNHRHERAVIEWQPDASNGHTHQTLVPPPE